MPEFGKKITQKDTYQDNLFDALGASAEKNTKKVDALDKSITQTTEHLVKMLNITNVRTQKGITDLFNISQKLNEQTRRATDLEKVKAASKKLAEKAEAAQVRQIESAIRAEERRQAAADRAAAATEKRLKREQKAAEEAARPYVQFAKNLNESRRASQDLGAQLVKMRMEGRENTQEYKRLSDEFLKSAANTQKLDKEIKGLDATLGQHQRKVGQYENALKGLSTSWRSLTGVATTLGVTLSGLALGNKVVSVFREFDEGSASIAKTADITKEAAAEISRDLTEIDTRTPISALQELGAAAGRLNVTGKKEIEGFVESADQAFVALGSDLEGTAEDIATNLGKVASVFGDEQRFGIAVAIQKTGSTLNELANKSKAAAGPILDFTNRVAGLGKIIKQTDAQALGAFFDEAGQSVEIAATTLNTLIPDLAANYEKFAKVAGMVPEEFKALAENSPIEALKAVAMGARNSEKGIFNLNKTLESYGVESARAASIVSLLTNNTERLTELQGIANKSFEEGTSLRKEFDTQNNTLRANIEKVSNAFTNEIINADKSTGIIAGISSALGVIANNLPEIINAVLKLASAFVTFKVVMAALKLKDQIQNFADLRKGVASTAEGVVEAERKAKSFGNALKGIGFTIAIDLAIEFAVQLWDIASGARQAREDLARLQKQQQLGADRGNARVSDRATKLSEQLADLDRQQNERAAARPNEEKIIADDILSQKERIIAANTKEIQSDIKAANSRKKIYKENLELNQSALNAAKSSASNTIRAAIGNLSDMVAQNTADISGTNKALEIYYAELRAAEEANKDLASSIKVTDIELTDEQKKAIEARTKALEDYRKRAEDIEDGLIKEEEERQISQLKRSYERELAAIVYTGIDANRLQVDLAKKLEEDIQKVKDEAQKKREDKLNEDNEAAMQREVERRQAEIDSIDQTEKEKLIILNETLISDEEFQNQSVDIHRKALEEKIKLLEQYGQDATDLRLELAQLERDEARKAADKEKAEAEKKAEEEKKRINENAELRKATIGEILDTAIASSKKEEQLLDKQISNEEKFNDEIKQAAREGNISAQESIKESTRIIQEQTLAKREEERKQAELEELKLIYQFIETNLNQGDDTLTATAKAITEVKGIGDLYRKAKGFFKGTKGKLKYEMGTPMFNGKDGYGIRADGEERILNGDLSSKIPDHITNEEVVNVFLRKQASPELASGQMQVAFNKASSNGQYEELLQVIKDKKEITISPAVINGITVGIEEKIKRGNSVVKIIHRR